MEKGIEKGMAKGREEGRGEGRTEEKIEVVIKSDKAGLSAEIISKITGLSFEEIKRILQQ